MSKLRILVQTLEGKKEHEAYMDGEGVVSCPAFGIRMPFGLLNATQTKTTPEGYPRFVYMLRMEDGIDKEMESKIEQVFAETLHKYYKRKRSESNLARDEFKKFMANHPGAEI